MDNITGQHFDLRHNLAPVLRVIGGNRVIGECTTACKPTFRTLDGTFARNPGLGKDTVHMGTVAATKKN
jgi:hypothetical protein